VATPSLRELATAVAFDVNRTIGGGHASIELLRRTFTARGWLDGPSHGLIVAVSRLTPGTNILAYCVMLGWRSHRAAGAATALVAASIPAALVVFALTVTLVRVDRYPAVQVVLAVGILVASALVLASAWNLTRPYITTAARRRALVIALVAATLIVLGATPVRTLLVAAAVGFLLPDSVGTEGSAPPADAPADTEASAPRSAPSVESAAAGRRTREPQR
jgi:chromate transporter